MAENTVYVNKVSYFGQDLIDLTGDQVTPSDLLLGTTAHDRSGAPITGTMPNNGTITRTISNKDDSVQIPSGYHNGSGTVTIAQAEKAKLIAQNIRSGVEILGTTGNMHPRPEWLSRGDNAAWKYAYMNRSINWHTVLPSLEYKINNSMTIVGYSVPLSGRQFNGLFWAVRSSFGYALIYESSAVGIPPIPIYATAAGTYILIDPLTSTFTVSCAAGWNTVTVPLPTDPENSANPATASCIFYDVIVDAGVEDLTQVAAGTPLAFGDYRPAPEGSITIDANGTCRDLWQYAEVIINVPTSSTPEGSITINANGTYRNLQQYAEVIINVPTSGTPEGSITINANGTYRNLWQYAEVIINVPTSGTEEEVTVEGNTLVFDGDTAVDGNTLALALEAEVKDKTLVILGASGPDATIDGNTLTVNGTTDGETLNLDATVNDNILMV